MRMWVWGEGWGFWGGAPLARHTSTRWLSAVVMFGGLAASTLGVVAASEAIEEGGYLVTLNFMLLFALMAGELFGNSDDALNSRTLGKRRDSSKQINQCTDV